MLKLIKAEYVDKNDGTALGRYTFEADTLHVQTTFVVSHHIKGDTLADNADAARQKAIRWAADIGGVPLDRS